MVRSTGSTMGRPTWRVTTLMGMMEWSASSATRTVRPFGVMARPARSNMGCDGASLDLGDRGSEVDRPSELPGEQVDRNQGGSGLTDSWVSRGREGDDVRRLPVGSTDDIGRTVVAGDRDGRAHVPRGQADRHQAAGVGDVGGRGRELLGCGGPRWQRPGGRRSGRLGLAVSEAVSQRRHRPRRRIPLRTGAFDVAGVSGALLETAPQDWRQASSPAVAQ